MGAFNVAINNTNLDKNFDEDDPYAINFIRLLARITEFENVKHLKKL